MTTSDEAYAVLESKGMAEPVEMAVIAGTGLGGIAEGLENSASVSYADLPGFPAVPVSGHEGRLVIGSQEGTRVAYMLGRSHFYEEGDPRGMAAPLETLALLGVQTVLITNSAGSVRADLYPGTLGLIVDHINFNGFNPLIGLASDGGFVSLTEAYDARLLKRLKRASVTSGVTLHEGVYMWFAGPSFETPAEIKMARLLGADLVGMSTVPEVILARRLALRVAAVCVITNFGAGFTGGNPTHTETKEVAMQGAIGLRRLIRAFLKTKEDGFGLSSGRDAR